MAAEAHRDYLAGETLAWRSSSRRRRRRRGRGMDYSEQLQIDGLHLVILRGPRYAALSEGSSSCSSFFFG